MQSSIPSTCHTLIYLFQILILLVTNIQILTKQPDLPPTVCGKVTQITHLNLNKLFCDFSFLCDFLADYIYLYLTKLYYNTSPTQTSTSVHV